MMTENFEYTNKVLLNIEKIFNNYVSIRNYASKTRINYDKQNDVASLYIYTNFKPKQIIFKFLIINNYTDVENDVEHIAKVRIENEAEEMIWYRDLSPLYHLEVTGRTNLLKLFPEPYVAKQGEVDESKIYEYAHNYLSALKVVFEEPDFQKLLYDPEYWIHESPYK